MPFHFFFPRKFCFYENQEVGEDGVFCYETPLEKALFDDVITEDRFDEMMSLLNVVRTYSLHTANRALTEPS